MIEVVGLKAVLDRVDKYVADARRFDDANAKMVRSVDQTDRAAGRAAGGVSKLGIAVGAAAGAIAASAIGAAIQTVTGQVGKLISDSSNLAESQSKVNVVFGESADEITAWASTAATAIGQSKQQALEAAGTYGNLFQAFGVGRKESTAMSKSLVELAADLASFNNSSVDDALLALRSGLSGETEPLKRFGVALTDDRLKLEAMKLGIISTTKDALNPGAKAQAAYSLIMNDTALAQGDFARTSAGLANQQRILTANITNLRARIGNALLPVMTKIVQFLNQRALPAFEKLITILGPRLAAVTAVLRGRLNPETFRRFGFAADFARDVVKELLAIFRGGFGVLARVAALIGAVAAAIVRFVQTSVIIIRFLRDADDELFRFGLAMRPLPGPIVAVAEALRTLIRFVDRVTEPVRNMVRGFAGIVDPAKLAAGAIAAFIVVLAAAEAVKFAAGVAQIAGSFIAWPFKVLSAATTTLLDFGKALLGIPSRKIAEEAGQAATGIGDDCHDRIAKCIHKPEVDEAALAKTEATLDLLAQDRTVEIKPETDRKGLAKGIGLKLAVGIAQGLGAALGAAIAVVIASLGIGVVLIALAALAAVIALALVGFLIYKFRREIGRFFKAVGAAILSGLRKVLHNLPEILGGIGAAAVAAFLLAYIVLPFLVIRTTVRAVKGIVAALADLGRAIGPPIGKAIASVPGIVQDGLRALPGLFLKSFRLAVSAGVKEIRAFPGQIRDLPANIERIVRAIPGVVRDALKGLAGVFVDAFREGVDLLPDTVRAGMDKVLAYLRTLPERFAAGFRDVWNRVNAQTDDSLNEVRDTVISIAGSIGAALKDGIVAGFRGAFGVGGDVFSAIRSGFLDIVRDVIKQLNDAIPNSIPVPGPLPDINLPDNPIPNIGGGGGGGGLAPGPRGGFAGGTPSFQHGTPFVPHDMAAFLHRGERVVDARQNRILSLLAGGLMAAPRTVQGGATSVLVPISVYAQGGATERDIKRLIHVQVDRTFTLSRRRTTRAGRPLSSGTG